MDTFLERRVREILENLVESYDDDASYNDNEDIYIITIEALETAFKEEGYAV